MANREVMRKGKMVLKIGDLTEERVDVIVNAANTGLKPGGGVCGAIHRKAGDGVFKECEEILEKEDISAIQTGEARMTSAGNLKNVKAIIHAAGPIGSGETELRAASPSISFSPLYCLPIISRFCFSVVPPPKFP